MATLNPPISPEGPGPEPEQDVRLVPLPAADRRRGLAMLLSGRADPEAPAVDPFLAFAKEQQLSLDGLWGALRGERLLTACLLVTCAGRSGMLFTSPLRDSAVGPIQVHLIRALLHAQDPAELNLVQSLLDMDQTQAESLLSQAGFGKLAVLAYMQRAGAEPARPLDLANLGPRYHVRGWTEELRPLFAQAILESYEDTLDCPGLLGVRSIDDIIAGHQATGRFVPELWHLICDGDRPAGVLLLTDVPARQAMELVYLGVGPQDRRRGLARKLMRYALGLTHGSGRQGLMLAVDEANHPAIRLYRSLGFAVTARKIAMTLSLNHELA